MCPRGEKVQRGKCPTGAGGDREGSCGSGFVVWCSCGLGFAVQCSAVVVYVLQCGAVAGQLIVVRCSCGSANCGAVQLQVG